MESCINAMAAWSETATAQISSLTDTCITLSNTCNVLFAWNVVLTAWVVALLYLTLRKG